MNSSCPHPRGFDDLETVAQFLSDANSKVVAERLLVPAEVSDVFSSANLMYVAEKLGLGEGHVGISCCNSDHCTTEVGLQEEIYTSSKEMHDAVGVPGNRVAAGHRAPLLTRFRINPSGRTNYHCMVLHTEMQRWATGNTARRYIFAVDGGMFGMAARNSRRARFVPQWPGRAAARTPILCYARFSNVICDAALMPPRINMRLQRGEILGMQQNHLAACIRPQCIMQRASIHDRGFLDHNAGTLRNATVNRRVE
jgi:hypothetical protein